MPLFWFLVSANAGYVLLLLYFIKGGL